MAIKNGLLGGTDWADGDVLYAADLNATINAAIEPVGAYASVTSDLSHTGDTNWTDITGATVTLSGLDAGTTYRVYAMASGNLSSSANVGSAQLLIDSTAVCLLSAPSGGVSNVCLTGMAEFTGATSCVVKVQYKISNAGSTVYWSGSSKIFPVTAWAIVKS